MRPQRKDFAPARGYNVAVSVYVEVVLLNNLALDALLVQSVLFARRRKVRKLRFVLAVSVAASVAVAYAVAPEWARIVVRVLLAPAVTLIFDRYDGVKDYIISLLLFSALTFALGGAVSGVNHLLGTRIEGYPLLGLVAACAVALEAGLHLAVRSLPALKRSVRPAGVRVKGEELSVSALCDSGNSLTDAVSGLPVIIVSESLANRIDGWHGKERYKQIEGYIELETVSGRTSLPLVAVESVRVGRKVSRAYAALAEKDFDGYEIILQNTMF